MVKTQKSPFLFGQIVDNQFFVNRIYALETFKTEVVSGIHQIIISPRRWGKSSFVKQAEFSFGKNKEVIFCFIDLFSIRSEKEFFEAISRALIEATNNTLDEVRKALKDYLGSLMPKLTISPDPAQSFDIDFNWKKQATTIDEVLNLPEKIAKKKKTRIVMCFDEFQGIADFSESKSFQKLLRSYWQRHKHVTYCLYGSKRSMMTEMFEKQSMPFYRFGSSVYLQKINEPEFTAHIIKRFKSTKKMIPSRIAKRIVDTMERHPYYVQQLAHFVWLNTQLNTTDIEWYKAIDNLYAQNLILYQKDFESLSNHQIKLIKALCTDKHLKLTSKDVMAAFDLGSSATVLRSLEALEKKEVIDRFTSEIEFIDPGFKLWLQNKIFHIKGALIE